VVLRQVVVKTASLSPKNGNHWVENPFAGGSEHYGHGCLLIHTTDSVDDYPLLSLAIIGSMGSLRIPKPRLISIEHHSFHGFTLII
jgi:hypothetical protein